MNRLISTSALLICISTHASGQVYFDELYGSDNVMEGVVGTLHYQGGYLNLAYSGGDYRKPYLFHVDILGMETAGVYLDEEDSLYQFAVRLIQAGDSTFYALCGTKGYNGSISLPLDIGLFKFYNMGDGLQFQSFGHADRSEYPQNMLIDQTNRILLIGQATVSSQLDEEGDMYLIIADSNGNQLSENQYGGTNYDSGRSLIQTPDSGFLLLGWTRSYGAGQRDFYLVKTDSLGNQQWQRTYGGSGDEGGSCIIALSDGNYLLTGGGWNSTATGSIGRLYKIDPLGQVIWSKTYEHDPDNYLFKTIELEDGSFVSAGLTNTNDDAGWLIKTDSEGTLLWQRKYNKNNNTDLFYSVLATEDGGFLLSGQARNAETNSQDAWLLKVDSVGCPYPNCLVGIDEAEPTKVVADVWPNPASQFVRVQVTGNRLQQERATIVFTDMMGRSYSPPGKEGQGVVGRYMQYDVSTFENGIYVLTIVQNSVKTTLKVVVQH